VKSWTTYELPPLFPTNTGWTLRFKQGPEETVEVSMHWNKKPEPAHLFVVKRADFLEMVAGTCDVEHFTGKGKLPDARPSD
jgi:hypothetical protein